MVMALPYMSNNTYPVIRLEVERMKHSILVALSEHATTMDASVAKAVEAYCTQENIDRVVWSAAKEALDSAVREEVREFFRYSKPGRQAVREAVFEYLNRTYGDEQG